MQQALRHNQGKPSLHYILTLAHGVEAVCKVMEQGGIKYEEYNYLLGNKPDLEYVNAALRHLQAFVLNEHYDDDIGTMHIAQAAWNLLALISLNHSTDPVLHPEFDQADFIERWNPTTPEPTSSEHNDS